MTKTASDLTRPDSSLSPSFSGAAGTGGPPPAGGTPWHASHVADVLAELGTTREGLGTAEARSRLATVGPNVLPRARQDGPLQLLWRQIHSPLIWVLIASAALAIALGKVTDGVVVLAVVVLNTIIGFIQEYRASRALAALVDMVPEQVTVMRDGERQSVPAAELVPGDVVLLASGDRVPADMRLVALKGLSVEEAALTGESVPAGKQLDPVAADAPLGDRRSMVFGGTLVTGGTATAAVTTTGVSTELGRISAMLREAATLETPLTRALGVIGRYITVGILLVAAAMLVVGTLRATAQALPRGDALREALMFAIALAVGAIPEGLPAIVTIALAIGVQRMVARRAIIRKLPAVETLGSTTVICSDKTGTLTRNEMTVQALWLPGSGHLEVTGVGYRPDGRFVRGGDVLPEAPADARRLLLHAALCSDATLRWEGEAHHDGAYHVAGDPTEGALVVAAEKAGTSVEAARRAHPRLDVVPFESEHQYMATLHAMPDGARVVVKGAPEVVLPRCAGVDGGAVLGEVERLALRGMRVLAVASRPWDGPSVSLEPADVAGGLQLDGLVGMIDPPRAEAVEAVRACREAGITVKMITGDHEATARAIGRELGLVADAAAPEAALSGAQLGRMDDAALREAAERTHVFARVAPEHKLRLVRALQERGHVVAMTGDGVNDAPALKQANIGVAMGITGTSVSKETADVVLADDNFASIAAAVEEGRRVYDNLIKSLAFVLPTNLGLALILLCAVVAFPFDATTGQLLLPVLPTQLLWINLVATVSLALPLAFEAREPDIMRRPPRDPRAPVLNRLVVMRTVVVGALMAAGAIGLFVWEYRSSLTAGRAADVALAKAQTMAVTTVILFQVFYLLTCRSLRDSLRAIGLFSNPTVFAGIALVLGLQGLFVYLPAMHAVFDTMPLGVRDVALSTAAAAVVLPVVTLMKWLDARAVRRGARTVGVRPL